MKEQDKDQAAKDTSMRQQDSIEQKGNGSKPGDQKKKKKKDDLSEVLKNQLEEKDEQIKSLQEKLLYLQADFENFKKLKAKERVDTINFANEAIVKEILPVVDNLEMALKHAESTDNYKSIHEGVVMTLNELQKVLEKNGVSVISAVGEKFDPNLHEAFYQEERDDVEQETVVAEFQKGYLLRERLIRPSRVTVSKKPENN